MKERLDQILWKYGYVDSIEKAKRLIMLGSVIVNEQRIDKAGTLFKYSEEMNIRVKGQENPYVSRGGFKLKKAIDHFACSFQGKRVLDIGASTGGFTDCSLQEGAAYVYALDVGTNQLAWKLRKDPKVKSIEQCHVKDLNWDILDQESVDYIVMDVSFISVCGIFRYLYPFLEENGKLLLLIKPQFEVEKHFLEKGIVYERKAHQEVLERVIKIAKKNGFFLQNIEVSPILGGKGNVEYISCFSKQQTSAVLELESILEKAKEMGGLK